ncbi:serine hydrolase domain-containing protein, partial [Aphanothece microscopica]|uniref:serine hydrolase domain-containing protein n=1 Tax=Aphanothece microscopica TaxID=1049561 RepID=UPI0039847740
MLLAFAVALATLVGARTYALAQTTQPVRADAAGDLGDAALARWSDDTFGKAYSDGAFSGMALVVVRDGRGALRTQYGLARYNPDQPLEPGQTRLLIGSISKTFTGIAILQLVEAGRIRSIEEPANAYLERLQLPGARGAKISIKDLLTHSAGHELRNSGVCAHEVIASPVNGA